jgi:hypothetical protein
MINYNQFLDFHFHSGCNETYQYPIPTPNNSPAIAAIAATVANEIKRSIIITQFAPPFNGELLLTHEIIGARLVRHSLIKFSIHNLFTRLCTTHTPTACTHMWKFMEKLPPPHIREWGVLNFPTIFQFYCANDWKN